MQVLGCVHKKGDMPQSIGHRSGCVTFLFSILMKNVIFALLLKKYTSTSDLDFTLYIAGVVSPFT